MDIFILASGHCTLWPTAASPPVELLFSSDLLDVNDSCATFLGWSSCWPHRSGIWHCYATILLSTPGHMRHLPPHRSISSLVAFGLPPALFPVVNGTWLLPPHVDMFSVDRTWKSRNNFLLSTALIRSYLLSIPTTPFPRCTWFTWFNIPLLYPRLVPLCLVLYLCTLFNLLALPSKGNRCPHAWYDLRSDPRSRRSSTSHFTLFSFWMLMTPVSA